MAEKKEKEIVLDLSGKIKFSDTLYVSVGSLLLSGIIMLIQMIWFLSTNNWQFDAFIFATIFDFVSALRGEKHKKNGNGNGKEASTSI